MSEKKLMRSTNKVVAGVLGGLAEFLGIDPTLVRICFVAFCFSYGYGLFNVFFHGVISAAAGAAAHPFGGFVATVCAEKYSFCFSHGTSPYTLLQNFGPYSSHVCGYRLLLFLPV